MPPLYALIFGGQEVAQIEAEAIELLEDETEPGGEDPGFVNEPLPAGVPARITIGPFAEGDVSLSKFRTVLTQEYRENPHLIDYGQDAQIFRDYEGLICDEVNAADDIVTADRVVIDMVEPSVPFVPAARDVYWEQWKVKGVSFATHLMIFGLNDMATTEWNEQPIRAKVTLEYTN